MADPLWNEVTHAVDERLEALFGEDDNVTALAETFRPLFVGLRMDGGEAVEYAQRTTEQAMRVINDDEATPAAAMMGAVLRSLVVAAMVTERS